MVLRSAALALCACAAAGFALAPGPRWLAETRKAASSPSPSALMSTVEAEGEAADSGEVPMEATAGLVDGSWTKPIVMRPSMSPLETWRLQNSLLAPLAEEGDARVSRFDRYKAYYKGHYNEVDEEAVEFSYDDFASVLADTEYGFKIDEIVTGTVVKFDGEKRALIEIGAKSAAVLPVREISINELEEGEKLSDKLDVGESYEFQVISNARDNGQVILSIRRMEYRAAWDRVNAMQADDPVIEGKVIAVNRGGAMVLVEGLRAFLPGSHMVNPGGASEDMLGKVLKLKFLEVNQEANKLVVSNRRAVIEAQMKEVSRGDVLSGAVAAIKPYGAFIDVGGMSGLLHISQISYDRIENLADTLAVGMPIKCMIIDHDKVNGRIALSTKTLEPEPGDMLRNPERVYELAEDTAAKYHARMEAERVAREQAAKEIVMGLADGLDGLDDLGSLDVLASPSDAPAADE